MFGLSLLGGDLKDTITNQNGELHGVEKVEEFTVNQAPHQLDLWQWIIGKPKKVFAKCAYGYKEI